MKITINQDGIKREIEGPFSVCLSREYRDRIVECLSRDEDFTYGWINIYSEPDIKITPNTKPLPWNSASNVCEPSDIIQTPFTQ